MKTKNLVFSVMAFLLSAQLYAQPSITQQRAFGTVSGCEMDDVKLTADGGLIIGGRSASAPGIDKTEDNRDPNRATNDYWIVKVNALGNKQWDRTLGGSNIEDLTCISQTRDYGYIAGGRSYSGISGDKTQSNRSLSPYEGDYWIVKLDSFGNKLWDKTIGGNKDDDLRFIDTTNDGGYILCGSSYSDASGEKTANSFGLSDYWVVKLDSLGNIQWDKTIGGSEADQAVNIKQTKDGGYIVSGFSYSGISGSKTESNKSDKSKSDYWVVRLDAAGNIIWDKTIGGTGNELWNQVLLSFDGSYIVGGRSDSPISGNKTENSKGGMDYWLVKLDANGIVQYDKTLGGNDYDALASLEQTKDSGLIIGGTSKSGISGDKTEPNRTTVRVLYDYWVIKLDKRGRVQWDKTIGGNMDDLCVAVHEYNRNTYLVAGESGSDISKDRKVALKGSTFDDWLVLLNYPAPSVTVTRPVLTVNTATPGSFTAYPNPVKDIIHIQSAGKSTFILTNLSGKIVLTKTISGNGQINVAHLPAGVYYLQNVATGTKQKVLIE